MDALLDAPPPASLGQALLFSPEIEERVSDEEAVTGHYTAERFRRLRPADYSAAVVMLGAGIGLLKIAKYLGHCHHLTIAAIRNAEPEAIDIATRRLIADFGTGITLLLERVLQNPSALPMTHVGMTIDQFMRNRELLAGRPTGRVEHVERIDVFGDWDGIVGAFVSEKELPAEMVREIPLQMGLAGGKKLPIAATDGDSLPAGELTGDLQLAADESDVRSLVSRDHHEATRPPLTTFATDSDAAADPGEQIDASSSDQAQEGAGGVARVEGGGPSPDPYEPSEIFGQ